MNEFVIKAEGLSKRYQLGNQPSERYAALRDRLARTTAVPWGYLRGRRATPQLIGTKAEDFWALKNVSFEIAPGQVVGIVGRNGAGKSTLLKILGRIPRPSGGRARVRGRIASLLEVGTGFHPELTGRQNIFLNGAILGMTRTEITRRFDEIVSFAGVEAFLDTPVKRYSSGMFVRLAFAVAAHLEPESLLVDEVLAVGDGEFQKKCLAKMHQVSRSGRTIIFVSHNLAALRHVCCRALLIDKGTLVDDGEVNAVLDRYLSLGSGAAGLGAGFETAMFSGDSIRIRSTRGAVIKTFDPVEITVQLTAKTDIADPGLFIGFLTPDGHRLAGLDFKDFLTVEPMLAGATRELGFRIDKLPFLAGRYQLELHVKDMATFRIEQIAELFPFEIVETPVYGGRKLDAWFGNIGLLAQPLVVESTETRMAAVAWIE